MTNFLVIVVALAAGYLLRRAGKVPGGPPTVLNAWILYVAMPAVVLQVVPRIAWTAEALAPLTAPVLVLAGAWVWTRLWARRLGWSRDDRTAVFLPSGLANTSFVGFPLILAWYGPPDLGPALLADQVSFFLLATVGLGTAAAARLARPGAEPRGPSPGRLIARRVLTFPPLLAFTVALLWPADLGRTALEPLFAALSATLAPLALFSVGVQMSFSLAAKGGPAPAVGLVYKLLIAPALVLGVLALVGATGPAGKIAVFEAAMAPMITTAVVAAEFGTSPRLTTALVAMGIPLSLLTTAGWW